MYSGDVYVYLWVFVYGCNLCVYVCVVVGWLVACVRHALLRVRRGCCGVGADRRGCCGGRVPGLLGGVVSCARDGRAAAARNTR